MATSLPSRLPSSASVYAALWAAFFVMVGLAVYAFFGLTGKVAISPVVFFTGNILNFCANALVLFAFWNKRQGLSLNVKILILSWTGVMAWYSFPLAVLMMLTVQFDTLQLAWLNFSWMWLPAVGIFVASFIALALAYPITSFLRRPQQLVLPGKLYHYAMRYPLYMGIITVVLVLVGHSIGVYQLAVFAYLPVSEQIKIIVLGLASSLFFALFYYLAYDQLLKEVRRNLEERFYVKNVITRRYSHRAFGISLFITFGSLLLVSIIVLQSHQRFIIQKLEIEAGAAIQAAEQDFTRVQQGSISYDQAVENSLLTLPQGSHGQGLLIKNSQDVAMLDIADETQMYIQGHKEGVMLDGHRASKIVSFFTEPIQDRKIVGITAVGDFYGLVISGLEFFALAGSVILLLTTFISTFASHNFSRSIQQLSQAVRKSQQSRTDFAFDTNTADELEDLAHAFRYYINQSNEWQRDLEQKVQERTNALVRIQEEKSMLEVRTAQQTITSEQQRRQAAEATATDLDQRVKERTVELEEAVRHLKELDKVKSEFISIASHQLRTPLTVIRWAYQSLLDETGGPISESQEKMVKAGLQKTLFMIRLVNNLLDITRIEGDRFKLEYTEVQLDKLLEQIISDAVPIAKVKGVEISLAKLTHPVPSVWLDQEKIQMVVGNVIDNAIKYTNKKGVITVSLTMSGGVYTIKVQDNGIGVPKDQIYRLFTKFFRSSNAVSLHTDGSGLGLYIAKTIIERHGGFISVESEEGKGTTFTIRLPATRTTEKPPIA